MAELAPVAPRERLLSLDVLRGLALCGVLIGNMQLLSGRWAGLSADGDPRLDELADWFELLVVSSKAQTLLTFLFGLGFATQLLRAEERGRPVMGAYARRLLALFAFGLLHVTLLWWGDVTWTYALAGWGLLLFVRVSDRTRVAWALTLVFVPQLVLAIFPEVARAIVDATVGGREAIAAGTRRMRAALEHADKVSVGVEHVRYVVVWCGRLWGWYFFWLVGRFLLGYVAGRRRWFERDGADHLPVFRRLALVGGALTALCTTIVVLDRRGELDLGGRDAWSGVARVLVHETGLLAQTSFYIAVVVLLLQRGWWRRVLGVIAPAGRMPLTVYVGQSLIATFLFYGWGLGWAGRVSAAGQLGLSFAIFAVEVALAHLWLRWYRFGPLEWLWRWAVYLERPPMRRGPPAATMA